MRLLLITCAFVLPCVSPAQSLYNVHIDTSRVRGNSGKLVFDITSNHPLTNRADLLRFTTDGLTGLPETSGGLVTGDLVQHLNPAPFTRLKASAFLTELVIPFQQFGNSVSFGVNVSETAPEANNPPDQFSFFVLDAEGQSLGGARGKPDFSITITGERGGRFETVSASPGSRAPAIDAQALGENGAGRSSAVSVKVTPAWTPDDPALDQQAKTFEGTLTEYCNRRCAGEKTCTGGAFGVAIDEETFYAFDDVGNLKAQVALVDKGVNPQVEGQFGRAKIVGTVQNSTLTVRAITLY